MNKLLKASLAPHIVRNSIKITLLVGTVLNLINQGNDILHGDTIAWLHLLLNYLVPFCVASYSAARNEMERGVE